jgi:hypothetical protein
MHPFDSLLNGWEIIDTVGLSECLFCFLRWFPRLPLTTMLGQWYAISAVLVAHTCEEWFTLACDEYILFIVDGHSILGENGDVSIICDLSYTH